MQEVTAGVWHVTASDTNFVLVRDGDSVTLIDTGYPGDRQLLEHAIGLAGGRPADLSALLLTHAHVDHTGSAEWLRAAHGVPVRCHGQEVANALGEVHEAISTTEVLVRAWRPKVLLFTLNAARNGALTPTPLEHVDPFTDEEALDVAGAPVPVHTPGHTSGHTSYHLPDRGVLVAGDALITVDVWDHGRTGPQLIRPIFNQDHERADRSLDRLVDLDAEVVLPGHGAPFRGSPAAAVELARSRGR